MSQSPHTPSNGSSNGASHAQSTPAAHGTPAAGGAPGAHGSHGASSAPRVSATYTFYRLRPEVFSLPLEERERLAAEFEDVVNEASDHLGLLRTYSLVGLRGDADLLFWQAADKPDGLQRFSAALRRAGLFRYLEVAYQYLAMTRRSIYVNSHVHEGQDGTRTRVQPAGAPYLFVYPFIKTRPWYALPMAERQQMMDEHIAVGHKYPNVKINTMYSFGIDDQEFVVSFESDSASDFLDLVMELRSSAASAYTLRDTPTFTCVAQPLDRALALALGTAAVADVPGAELESALAAAR